ncbi:MAG: methionyl-tRNA formyltransferase [Bacteroidales bacterium]|nr:methionyl-tRNA formyltransferase [Bacteroidales bacterium]
MNRELRIIYMGTPEFAVEPLRAIVQAGYNVLAVVTALDKPAGRGQKIHYSAVKEFALANNIRILQPEKLKNPDFLKELVSLNANLQVVVAFRMLPEVVWQMPEYGTLNLHASLLPQYRGAAPINHVIINGETETGLTTFFIEQEIDTGNIILSRKLPILPSDNAGALHDRLMVAGGEMMLETLKMIEAGSVEAQKQENIISEKVSLKPAPKIFKTDCRINWADSCLTIHNRVRGLSPFPGAFSNLITDNEVMKQVKIFRTSFQLADTGKFPGTIITDDRNSFSVVTGDGLIHIEELQMEGKKRLNTAEFLRGIHLSSHFRFE